MSDNTTPFFAKDYEENIQRSVPFYEQFHEAAIDLVKAVKPAPRQWLDTGCGTGSFARKAARVFKETAFTLADPSAQMLALAGGGWAQLFEKTTAALDCPDASFDVVTAFLSHHYLSAQQRRVSTENCWRMLRPGGVYITFENIRPGSPLGVEISMKRWLNFKLDHGAPVLQQEHARRFDTEYFPVTVPEHITLLRQTGFQTAELLWLSYMQAGFYAVK